MGGLFKKKSTMLSSSPNSSEPAIKPTKPTKPCNNPFLSIREAKAHELYLEFNTTIFDDRLPLDMKILWKTRLHTTSGQTLLVQQGSAKSATIQLSTKVIDSEDKLRTSLCHEMCHAATWLINGVSTPPHGDAFQGWAAAAMHRWPDLKIKTCHNYEINFKYQYKCQNLSCGHIFGRHSNSIDVSKKACGCGGRLALLPRTKMDGTPAKPRAASPYTVFVKKNFSSVKGSHPQATWGEIMTILSQNYKSRDLIN